MIVMLLVIFQLDGRETERTSQHSCSFFLIISHVDLLRAHSVNYRFVSWRELNMVTPVVGVFCDCKALRALDGPPKLECLVVNVVLSGICCRPCGFTIFGGMDRVGLECRGTLYLRIQNKI